MAYSKSASGFTLVELAIAMMVIGLLIGGVLKGQELIENARNMQIVRQVQGYQSAVATFRDSYNAIPGDMLNPGNRLPNCTTSPCNVAGNDDGFLGTPSTHFANQTPDLGMADEGGVFWFQMAATRLVTFSRTPRITAVAMKTVGENSIILASFNRAANLGGDDPTSGQSYEELRDNVFVIKKIIPAQESTRINTGLSLYGRQAAMIDGKMDDGLPLTGDVQGFSNLSGTESFSTNGNLPDGNPAPLTYNTSFRSQNTNLLFRFP